jgi:hypothetical protein
MEEIEYEAVPSPEARRMIRRTFLSGIAVTLLGACAVLLAVGWIGAMVFDARTYMAPWTPLLGTPALVFIGGMIGWRLGRRSGTRDRSAHEPTKRSGQVVPVRRGSPPAL